MIPALIEAILRTEFLALRATVQFGLCGIQNMPGQEAALGFVLAMPSLKPMSRRFQSRHSESPIVKQGCSMTLLQELQALLEARSGAGHSSGPLEAKMIDPNLPRAEDGVGSTDASASVSAATESGPERDPDRQGQISSRA